MNRGFTIIELLVASTIIAVLATIGLASYSSTNVRARNSKRLSDLEQIRNAEEMYKADVGSYGTQAQLTAESYISPWPTDPKSGFEAYAFLSTPTTTYCLCARMEPPIPSGSACTPVDPRNFCVKEP